MQFSLKLGCLAASVGLITFSLSWQFYEYWGGPLPGYDILLFPGNLSLIYLWYPLFSEEVALYPKLTLLLIGQFSLVFVISMLIRSAMRKLRP